MKDANGTIVKRDSSGRYSAHEVCEACRKPIKGDYCSDEDTLPIGGAGLLLCDRVRCCKKREAMPPAERAAYYQRANEPAATAA